MTSATRKLTGWHVLAIFTAAFGVIIGVNLTLAFNAVATFPGLETGNSYVASQSFDARRDAQQALGWTVTATADDGRAGRCRWPTCMRCWAGPPMSRTTSRSTSVSTVAHMSPMPRLHRATGTCG